MTDHMRFGARILERADELASITERPGMVARSYLTPQHREAGERIASWMREAGMHAAFDALGNVVGRYEGRTPGAPSILGGSHMDTVVDAGRYDGLFGILALVECVADLDRRRKRLDSPVEVVAFGDEEGVRFGTPMIGSLALTGKLEPALLDRCDARGVSLGEALRAFGGDPTAIDGLRRPPGSILVYIEPHIEQGPVLLREGVPVGVVTAIAGATRARIALTGEQGHAGTVPMQDRRDALAAAAEMVLMVEGYCRASGGILVGTVGKIEVASGGAINAIPGRVEFTLDLRSPDDTARHVAVHRIRKEFGHVAEARSIDMEWQPLVDLPAAACDAAQQERLAGAIRARGLPLRRLASGAGHDAMHFSGVAPMAMLFVRCGNGGVSHNPLETMSADDAAVATDVLLHYLESLE